MVYNLPEFNLVASKTADNLGVQIFSEILGLALNLYLFQLFN